MKTRISLKYFASYCRQGVSPHINSPLDMYYATWKAEGAIQRCSKEKCSENMQQIYQRTPMPKCDFNKVAIELWIIVNCESLRKYFKLRKNIHSEYFQMYIHCTFIWETTFRCAPLFLVNHSIFLWCNFAGNLYDIKCLFIGKNGRKCNIN